MSQLNLDWTLVFPVIGFLFAVVIITLGVGMNKLKIHLWTLGRWFGLPFFGGAVLISVALAGGSLASLNTWLAFAAASLVMAGGHSFNTYLDTVWTGLDSSIEEHSAEKVYTAGSVVISEGWASSKEVLVNGLVWYVLSLAPGIILAIRVTPLVLVPLVLGMGVTFAYSPSKFTYFHELVLASGVIGAAVLGALSTGTGQWLQALIVSIPLCIIFSFAGLALDEYPDAAQNIPKGVKSLAYKVWQFDFDLALYIMLWVFLAFLVQIFFVSTGLLKPLTGLTLLVLPPAIAASLFLKKSFKRAAMAMVAVAMAYPVLLLIGEVLG